MIVIPRKDAPQILEDAKKFQAADEKKLAAAKDGTANRAWVEKSLNEKGFEVIDQMLELNRTVEPDPEAVAAYGPVKEAFEVCYKAMLPVYEYMASHKNA